MKDLRIVQIHVLPKQQLLSQHAEISAHTNHIPS
jgi:hypothetical protein